MSTLPYGWVLADGATYSNAPVQMELYPPRRLGPPAIWSDKLLRDFAKQWQQGEK